MMKCLIVRSLLQKGFRVGVVTCEPAVGNRIRIHYPLVDAVMLVACYTYTHDESILKKAVFM